VAFGQVTARRKYLNVIPNAKRHLTKIDNPTKNDRKANALALHLILPQHTQIHPPINKRTRTILN